MISRCAPRSLRFDRTARVKAHSAGIGLVLLFVCLLAGCSRPAMQGETAQANPHPVPFHDPATATPVADTTISNKSETALPFQDVESLPVGTLLTVRLNDLVSADHPGPSNTFEAVLDEPVTIGGNVVVPRGSTVSGHVESAQISDVQKNRGYVRLDLQSIDIGGRELPLQTSSLFTRGTPRVTVVDGGKNSANVMTLEKGRRLTFRLTEPVYMAQRSTPAQ